jgi:hypothetical protein
VDSVEADEAEEQATAGFRYLCQRRLPLRASECYNCGKLPVALNCHPCTVVFILRRGAVYIVATPRRLRFLLTFLRECLAQLVLLLLGQVRGDDLEVVLL